MAVFLHGLVMYSRRRDNHLVTLIESDPPLIVPILALILISVLWFKQFVTDFRNGDVNIWEIYMYLLTFIVIGMYVTQGENEERSVADWTSFFSCVAEACGLIAIVSHIQKERNVTGISGNSFIIYAVCYSLRQFDLFLFSNGPLHNRSIVLECLQNISTLLCYSILWAVFKQYKHTYQNELDTVKAKPFLVLCVVLPVFIRPNFSQDLGYSYWWALTFYMEACALLPQAMMTRRFPDTNVTLPLVCFALATSISRAFDFYICYLDFKAGLSPDGGARIFGFNYTWWLTVTCNVWILLISANFLYNLTAAFMGMKVRK